ncbi:hypothetical protein [Amycolatopsis thermophila]|uniref:Uncharacterized protein n=1 Tax=Amycolatopsis thermophila TaxID=206084 RepID=A0ABU0EM79_9PSEU|nr:hypothetical protein [Amycolatopsis thermophila]MDQ0376376.1 hypothetical protein [Amycolatopsis thermophila]
MAVGRRVPRGDHELAGLPDVVRGYEEIKLAAVDGYRRQAELTAAITRTSSSRSRQPSA